VIAAVFKALPPGVTRTTYVPATSGVRERVAARVVRPAAADPTVRTRPETPEVPELLTVVTVEVSVSVGSEVAVIGALNSTAVAVFVSEIADARNETVTTEVVATPTVVDEVATDNVVESADGAADEGATATRLRPKAATATSAMRLKVVFVDICFLSIFDLENLPSSA